MLSLFDNSVLYWNCIQCCVCLITVSYNEMRQRMTKPTKWHVRPAKTLISLGIRPVWSESSLTAQWIANDPSLPHADSEDSDQTGRMPRLIWVFAGRICNFVGFVMPWLKLYMMLYLAKSQLVPTHFNQLFFFLTKSTHSC